MREARPNLEIPGMKLIFDHIKNREMFFFAFLTFKRVTPRRIEKKTSSCRVSSTLTFYFYLNFLKQEMKERAAAIRKFWQKIYTLLKSAPYRKTTGISPKGPNLHFENPADAEEMYKHKKFGYLLQFSNFMEILLAFI